MLIWWVCCRTNKNVDPTNFEKYGINDQLRKNDKNKRVNLKSQDLFRELITIKIGPLIDQDVVWVGVPDWPAMGQKIQLLVAEAGWSEAWLYSTLVNWRCFDVALVSC